MINHRIDLRRLIVLVVATIVTSCGGCVDEDELMCLGGPCPDGDAGAGPDPGSCADVAPCDGPLIVGVESWRATGVVPNCFCVPGACEDGYILQGASCVEDRIDCDEPGRVQEGNQCLWRGDAACHVGRNYEFDTCVKSLCRDFPTAEDGTDLALIGKCLDEPPPPPESCTNGCHDGIEIAHGTGASSLACTECHGGDPTAATRAAAHVELPAEWQQNTPNLGRPNYRYYWNYLTLTGVENFEGGREWLRFKNPSDLRIADMTCGKDSGCHQSRVVSMRRSLMTTAAGIIGTANARSGLPRTIIRDGDGVYQFDSTEGYTPPGGLTAVSYDVEFTGSTREISAFTTSDRAFVDYNEIDVLHDIYDKQCGDCHLTTAGRNDRYGNFRTSGCGGCHITYALDGRSRSSDQMINHDEPTYPEAYGRIANLDANDLQNINGQWLGPEQPHAMSHSLGLLTPSQRCGTCHSGSNHTSFQFRGYQIDPNRTAARALEANVLTQAQVTFTDEIPDDQFAKIYGLAHDQILHFVDWNDDGLDDIPEDVHYAAGLECVDCHTSGEMHNELRFVMVPNVSDWSDPNQVRDMSGALWSHQDQATEVECVHCHGNLELRAYGHDLDNRNPIRNLLVCAEPGEAIDGYVRPAECANLGNGRWLRAKFSGLYHYVAQTVDTVREPSRVVRPNGSPVYQLNSSIFHGRVNNSLEDGIGPCTDGDPSNCFKNVVTQARVRNGFSHLGEPARNRVDQQEGGLECTACHSTWANNCFGCHLRDSDSDGNVVLRDFSRSTGELTVGTITEADVTYISPLDTQYGINSEGKIAHFISESNLQVAHTTVDNLEFFGTDAIVNNDVNIEYNAYRHRSGYGLRQYQTESVGRLPGSGGQPFEQSVQMDENAGQGTNPMMPHTVQRAHPRMSCAQCHVQPTGEGGRDTIEARYMLSTTGWTNNSAYLVAMGQVGEIVRRDSRETVVMSGQDGFLLGDADVDPTAFNVVQQADYCVTSVDGFPLCSTNHPAKLTPATPGNPPWSPAYVRAYPTFTLTAGPFNARLLQAVLSGIIVENIDVPYRP